MVMLSTIKKPLFGFNSLAYSTNIEFLGVKSEDSYLCISCFRDEHDNCNLPDCMCECNRDNPAFRGIE